jgi:SAM-dependent methyltransferase
VDFPDAGGYEMNMNLDTLDWKALERMRAAFLAGTAGTQDYWLSDSDLAAYDATFAQRIGWKWDYVLDELKRRGWSPPTGTVLDWGCGSGIAGRAFLDHYGAGAVTGLRLWDRSTLAMTFAAQRAREKFAGLPVTPELKPGAADVGTLLISHVLTELSPEQIEALADLTASATSVLWVEPGTYEASLTLIAIRERLRERWSVVAPCTHAERCGILAPENERHWCHHFASPPAEVFTDGDWAGFANLLGIDLRDLPLSFLVLDARPAPPLPPGARRVIGHPRIYKGHALLLGCDAPGVRERKLTRRLFPEEFRALKKGEADVLREWECAGGEIIATKPLA